MNQKLSCLFASLALILTFSLSCNKNEDSFPPSNEKTALSVDERMKLEFKNQLESLISDAHADGKNPKIKTILPHWDKALAAEDDKHSIREYPVQLDAAPGFRISENDEAPDAPINSVTKLVFLKDKKTGDVQTVLMHVVPQEGTSAEGITYKKRDRFSGYVFYTTLTGSFINGWFYENGKITKKSKAPINSLLSPNAPADGQTCVTEVTYWYERTCYGTTCGAWEYIGSTSQTYCSTGTSSGGGGSGGVNTVYTEEKDALFNVDCNSFVYIKTSAANWQEAGLNNIRLRWSWIGGSNSGLKRDVLINHIVFGLPQKYTNATTQLTPGQAATLTAKLLDVVKVEVYNEFKYSPSYPSDEIVTAFFRQRMHAAMQAQGGTAGMTGSGSSSIIFKDEERSNFSNPYDCK